MRRALLLKTRKPGDRTGGELPAGLGEVWGCRRPTLQSMVALQVTTGTPKDCVSKAGSLDVMISCLPTTSEMTQEAVDFEGLPTPDLCLRKTGKTMQWLPRPRSQTALMPSF